MSAFDQQMKDAFNKGQSNNKTNVTKQPQKSSTVTKPKNHKTPISFTRAKNNSKTKDTNNEGYSTIRASQNVADIYKALQIATRSKSRSQTMALVAKVAKPKVLNTVDKKKRFNKTLKALKLMRTL